MCHPSCLSCTNSQQFSSCLSCVGSNILYNSVCYCASPWNGDCTSISEPVFEQTFKFFHTFLLYSFILAIVLFSLKIKLPLTYRVLSGLQALSLLIFSPTFYLDFEDQYMLRTFNNLFGAYQLTYRLESISNSHAIQVYTLLVFFLVVLILIYYPFQTFSTSSATKAEKQKYESFYDYIQENILECLENFYYFGGKLMFFFIGLCLSSGTNDISIVINVCVFAILILGTFVRLISQYHKNNLSEEVYQSPLYLYCMLSNAVYIGMPLVITSEYLVVIYCIPAGLLLLIALLNKDLKINDRNSISFFVIEGFFIGAAVGFILVGDEMKTYILLIVVIISSGVMVGETAALYHGGFSFTEKDEENGKREKGGEGIDSTGLERHKGGKVHPLEVSDEGRVGNNSSKLGKSNGKKNSKQTNILFSEGNIQEKGLSN